MVETVFRSNECKLTSYNVNLWKEATAAMTALVYSGLHTHLYRRDVHVY
jgi:hypothetical protein